MKTFLVVIDGFGVGEAADAKKFGDNESNTLLSLLNLNQLNIPNLTKLGLLNIDGIEKSKCNPIASFGRMQELSLAKDTTAGHWEIAGVVSEKPFPTFPNGFPKEIVKKLETAFNKQIILNKPYSGTDALRDFGKEHIETGKPIVYTSADSVLQIATHTSLYSLKELYEMCAKAREIMQGEFAVGRIIARPFDGDYPNFSRTQDRKDFSLEPPFDTVLDNFKAKGLSSIGIGKIEDIFAFRGLTESFHTHTNLEGLNKLIELTTQNFDGLVFANLVDTDMKYGHRRDVKGYMSAIEEIDENIGVILKKLTKDDTLIITSDHGCDPSFRKHTDHTREYVPLLVYSQNFKVKNLGTLKGFDCVADTIRDMFGLRQNGKSFLNQLK